VEGAFFFFLRLKDNVNLESSSGYRERGAANIRVDVEGVTYRHKVMHVDESAVWGLDNQ
jgi:hypothetical protein